MPTELSDGDRVGSRRRLRLLLLAGVAAVAAAAGAGAMLLATSGSSAPPSSSASQPPPGGTPSSVAPGQLGGNSPGGAAGTVTQFIFVSGRVTAVSDTSITIAGPGGESLRAEVTSSTRITGHVTSISSVKVGDFVSVQARESGSTTIATATQDPADLAGGRLPPSGG